MRQPGIDLPTVLAAVALALLAAAGVVSWWRRRPGDPEETERRRRFHLNQVGRIVEGRVLEILEAPPLPARPRAGLPLFRKRPRTDPAASRRGRKLIYYSYSISGVTYETAQDITGLEERACLDRLAAGQPASVKYDPANPGNSILVAEGWSGLH